MSLAATMAVLVLLGVCANVASARTLLNFSPDGNLESIEVLQSAVENLENVQSVLEEFGEENDGFNCKGLTCESCKKFKISKFSVKICVKVTYKPSTGNITAELTVAGKTVWKLEFPVGKAPSPCIKVSIFGFKVEICVTFDLHVDSHELNGCVKLKVTFPKGSIDVNLGCFRLKFVDSVDLQEPRQEFIPLIRAMTMVGRGSEDVEMTKSEETNDIL